MDEKAPKEKIHEWSEEVEQILIKSDGNFEKLEDADRNRVFDLFSKISKEKQTNSSPKDLSDKLSPMAKDQLTYMTRAGLFLCAVWIVPTKLSKTDRKETV